MFKIKVECDSLEKLEQYIKIVQALNKLKVDRDFQQFIQNKCLETVRNISMTTISGSTNDEYVAEYISRHSIQEYDNGFVLYNNFTIPAVLSTKNTKNQERDLGIVRNYDEGFSIALALEYGTGLVGQENPVQGAWEYNVNNYGEAGWFYKSVNGEVLRTRGFKGFEIYRYTAEHIKNNYENWIREYLKNDGGVS